MPTVAEILEASGLTKEQISALDAKVTEGFTKVLTAADAEREKAELAQRAVKEEFETKISPALDAWANEKANYEAKMAAYDAALKAAKEGGFNVPDILAHPNPNPTAQPGTRGPDGKFVPNANPVPGSPAVDTKALREELGGAFVFAADTQWKYRQLFGKEMPDSPSALIKEASERRMSPGAWAAQKYEFQKKETEIATAAEKAKIDAAVKEATDKVTREFTEKYGSNPNVRQGARSEFSEIHKAVKSGTRPDPIAPGVSEAQRDAGTRAAIRADIASQAVN